LTRTWIIDRFHQALLIGSALALSWLGMMFVHNVGHLIYAWVGGGRVNYWPFHPLDAFTCPRLTYNPNPLLVLWGGPIWGCALPLLLLWLVRAVAPSRRYLALFFAGFCLVANGSHLAAGALYPYGDAERLLRFGVPEWALLLFGMPMTLAGLGLFHGLGAQFGLGSARGRVDRRTAWLLFGATVVAATTELLLAARWS
jgi:hypothetical protein